MITTVTLNPAIDKTLTIDKVKPGAVNRIDAVREDMGGKGINISKLLHRLDIATFTTGFLGSVNSRQTHALMDVAGFGYDFVEIDAKTRVNTKLVELELGITTDLNEPGFVVSDESYKELKARIVELGKKSSFMVFSGSIPKGIGNNSYKELIDLVKESGCKTGLDADGDRLLEGIKSAPYLIKPNIYELERAFEKNLPDDQSVIDLGRHIIEKYGVTLILVSMGENGSILISEDEVYKSRPISVEVRSTVGAGDSMLAGMLCGISTGKSLAESLALSTACGTLAVTKEGTETFSMDDVRHMLKQVKIIKL